jgi:hypothetical protein
VEGSLFNYRLAPISVPRCGCAEFDSISEVTCLRQTAACAIILSSEKCGQRGQEKSMGSVVKKRRKKIARHKYRKRLKRDRWKRRH